MKQLSGPVSKLGLLLLQLPEMDVRLLDTPELAQNRGVGDGDPEA